MFPTCGVPFSTDFQFIPATSGGTVTSVSVTPSAGVSGTVATATTTPAITIILGNITPTSVNSVVISGASTPTLTVTGTTTVSGNNTGDQTEFPDNTFRVIDNVDPTKKVAFETSTITTATTRTLTVPDTNGTIVLDTATQTLTNKTITTPIIITPTINTGMILTGATSGTVTITPTAITTPYAVILPPAQATGALTNDGSGNLSWTPSSSSIVGWTPSLNTSAPNNTVNTSVFLASGGTANQDAVIQPKGTGAFILQLPDSTATGGNKRGDNAIDLQTGRSLATEVASGTNSFAGGYGNRSSGGAAIAIGNTNISTGTSSAAIGELNTATGQGSIAMGTQNTAGGTNAAISLGKENVASGENSTIAGGYQNTASGDYSAILGGRVNSNAGADSVVMGQGFTFTSAADNSFGFLSNPGQAFNMTIAAPNTSVFGNVNMWLANNDNTARELRFYEPYNTTGAFPNTANYSAFKAGVQTADITYTLPTADGASGTFLTTNGSGTLSWTAATVGTVTSVSVVTANGVSGTVATATTTPAITLTLAGIIPSLNTSAPNNTINASQVLANGGTTNQDLVLQPKGTGSLLAQLPDGTTAGGDKRGTNSVDWQTYRTVATYVTAGNYSVIGGGGDNYITGQYNTIAGGNGNYIQSTATGGAIAGGINNKVRDNYGFAANSENYADGYSSVALGHRTTVGDKSFSFSGVTGNVGSGTRTDVSAMSQMFFTHDVNLAIGNVDSVARELQLYSPNSSADYTTNAFYTAFKAGVQIANVTYTLPTDDGASGTVLSTNGTGTLSWIAASTGTVTTVSVTTANGISGTVATATTTPAITLALAGITPSLHTSSPNNVVNASMITASGGTSKQDLVLAPKDDGAIQAQLADSGTSGGNKRGSQATDFQRLRTAATQVASAAYTALLGGYSNTADATGAAVFGGQNNVASGEYSVVLGGGTNTTAGDNSVVMGQGLTFSSAADNSFGFLSNPGAVFPMTIASPNTSVFGNVNMWLANNDNTARELRFYEPYNTTGAFPNTANYTAFKAGVQSADITYTLPTADGSSGHVLSTNGSGVLSWTAASAGTVTSVSVTTANGVSGSVATATTTPAITITLGAITPTSVNGATITTTTGTITLANGSTLVTSGANSITFTSTGATNVTLPTSGTLMANPMTTGGDVIYGGASGAPTRLANGSNGQFLTSSGGTSAPTWTTVNGLVGFTSSLNTSAPNNVINASMLLASGGTTNQNAVISPKGTGAFQLQLADSTSTGGNVRGANAIDLQMSRSSASQVASGQYSFAAGSQNIASGTNAVAVGDANEAIGNYSGAIGQYNLVTGVGAFTLGSSNTVTANYAVALGYNCRASALGSVSIGYQTTAPNYGQFAQSSGYFTGQGDAQISNLTARNITTDTTQTELYLDGSSVRAGVLTAGTYGFEVRITGRRTDTPGSSYHAVIEGTISNNSGTTALDGSNTVRVITNTAGTWSAVAEADNTNDALVVKVTGASGETIRWVAAIKLVEVAS